MNVNLNNIKYINLNKLRMIYEKGTELGIRATNISFTSIETNYTLWVILKFHEQH